MVFVHPERYDQGMNENPTLPDDEILWQAVCQRDPRFDGRLVYAVRSTGIYCRPTCPSRRPRRSQVLFYAGPKAAEAAGFRPCLRCRPADPVNPAIDLVRRAQQLIEQSDERLSLAEMGAQIGVSPAHLQRTFKAATGLSPRQYASAQRARRFREQLRDGRGVTDAIYEAGYGSPSRVYEASAGYLGMSPAEYQKGGKGISMEYTLVDSALGRMLVAASARGICAVRFGDEDEVLTAELASEFPRAVISRSDERLSPWASAICQYLTGVRQDLDLPLELQGTAFQHKVWAELRRIPYGQTRSYTQVAEAIHQPAAVRAVARACATNPAALVVPCHRVVCSDGSLAGYRWGIRRKEYLLSLEGRK